MMVHLIFYQILYLQLKGEFYMIKDEDMVDVPKDDELDSFPDDLDEIPSDEPLDDSFLDDFDDSSNNEKESDSFENDADDDEFDSEFDDDWENEAIPDNDEFSEYASNELTADTIELDEDGNYVELIPHMLDIIPCDEELNQITNRVSLFHQSVVETVIETWQSCPQMCCDLLPEFPYVGLYFDSTQVGGFSFKDRKNEDKGSIIECINSGRIMTLITPGLLNHKSFVFLPNASTLLAMDDFELLTNANYTICFCDAEGNVYLSDLSVSYVAIARMILADINIRESIVYSVSSKSEVDFDEALK